MAEGGHGGHPTGMGRETQRASAGGGYGAVELGSGIMDMTDDRDCDWVVETMEPQDFNSVGNILFVKNDQHPEDAPGNDDGSGGENGSEGGQQQLEGAAAAAPEPHHAANGISFRQSLRNIANIPDKKRRLRLLLVLIGLLPEGRVSCSAQNCPRRASFLLFNCFHTACAQCHQDHYPLCPACGDRIFFQCPLEK